MILIMEATHRAELSRLFPAALRGKRVACLDIPDNYDFMHPELVRLLRDRVGWAIPARATDAPE